MLSQFFLFVIAVLFRSASCQTLFGSFGSQTVDNSIGCAKVTLGVDATVCGLQTKTVTLRQSDFFFGDFGNDCTTSATAAMTNVRVSSFRHILLTGNVHYVVIKDQSWQKMEISREINSHMDPAFQPTELLVITYLDVYLSSDTSKKNTIQTVIASNGTKTYLRILYHDVNWCSSGVKFEIPCTTAENAAPTCEDLTSPNASRLYIYDISCSSCYGLASRESSTAENELYPFGSKAGDETLHLNTLSFSFPFNYKVHQSVTICGSGYVALEPSDCYTSCVPVQSVIAPFWMGTLRQLSGDEGSSSVHYRVSHDASMLSAVKNDIGKCVGEDIEPARVLVATWNTKSITAQAESKRNRFQLVLATDGVKSYAMYKYSKLEYPTLSDEYGTSFARALMVSHTCAAAKLPEDEVTESMLDLQHQSNCKSHQNGLFVYKVDSTLPSKLQGALLDWAKYFELGDSESINSVCQQVGVGARNQMTCTNQERPQNRNYYPYSQRSGYGFGRSYEPKAKEYTPQSQVEGTTNNDRVSFRGREYPYSEH